MKSALALAASILLCGQTCPAAEHPAVSALPVLGRIERPGATRIVIRGALPKKLARRMVRLAGGVAADVERRFLTGEDKSGLPPVDLCLFATQKTYDAFVAKAYPEDRDPSPLGFYLPGRRLIVANVGRSPGNLRHELAHALLGDDWPDMPDWINEGLGSLYGTAAWQKKGFRFLVNYRLRHLKAAKRAGDLPDLHDLAESGRMQIYGPRAMVWYGLSRYVLLYLDRRGELTKFIRELRAGAPTAGRQRALLTRYVDWGRFLKWVDRLKWPPRRRQPAGGAGEK